VNVLEPHPHLPLLATSGLDSDVKLWMPTASQPPSASTLQRVVVINVLLRHTFPVWATGCTVSPDPFPGQMSYMATKLALVIV